MRILISTVERGGAIASTADSCGTALSNPLLKYRSDQAGSSATAITTTGKPVVGSGDKDDDLRPAQCRRRMHRPVHGQLPLSGFRPDQKPHQMPRL